MNYEQTINWLFDQLVSFHRVGQSAYKENLNNITQISSILGNPHKKIKCIHVAGTNGKGSVCHLLSSVFQEEGYRVGLYTSPHLIDFRERIRINGIKISKDYVVSFVSNYRNYFIDLKLSFFEMTTAMAFSFFYENSIDIAIIETGLGGRLDATNIVQPELSVITNVSLDHQFILGKDVKTIAKEKAGIIKEGVPIVLGITSAEVKTIIKNIAKKINTKFSQSTLTSSFKSVLSGTFQEENTSTVIKSIEEMKLLGWKISDKALNQGLKNVIKNSGIRGRWEQLSSYPTIICDSGHNLHAFDTIIKHLRKINYNQLWMVLGFVKDKDINSIISLLPKNANYIFCQASSLRSIDANILMDLSSNYSISSIIVKNPVDALSRAKHLAGVNDLIFVGGSTFVVAEIIE